jgi:hypothetical protein
MAATPTLLKSIPLPILVCCALGHDLPSWLTTLGVDNVTRSAPSCAVVLNPLCASVIRSDCAAHDSAHIRDPLIGNDAQRSVGCMPGESRRGGGGSESRRAAHISTLRCRSRLAHVLEISAALYSSSTQPTPPLRGVYGAGPRTSCFTCGYIRPGDLSSPRPGTSGGPRARHRQRRYDR